VKVDLLVAALAPQSAEWTVLSTAAMMDTWTAYPSGGWARTWAVSSVAMRGAHEAATTAATTAVSRVASRAY
jgi:hypothetical protein